MVTSAVWFKKYVGRSVRFPPRVIVVVVVVDFYSLCCFCCRLLPFVLFEQQLVLVEIGQIRPKKLLDQRLPC